MGSGGDNGVERVKSSEVKCMTEQEGQDETAPEKNGSERHPCGQGMF